MTIGAFKAFFKSALNSREDLDSLFYIAMRHYLSFSKTDVVLHPHFEIPKATLVYLNKVIEALKKDVPIQYIIGSQHFMGLELKVTSAVLIPRPETEELVDYILRTTTHKIKPAVLDIGTGSGCIAIALALNLQDPTVHGIDLSAKALDLARENAQKHKATVHFFQEDILSCTHLPKTYDLIVSNPPYVCQTEKQYMAKNVLDYEPGLALFVEDDNPLKFYIKIALLAKEYLNTDGLLFFEINSRFGQAVVDMLSNIGFSKTKLQKDFLGKDRFVIASV